MIPFTQNIQNRQIHGYRMYISGLQGLVDTGNGQKLLISMGLLFYSDKNVLKLVRSL